MFVNRVKVSDAAAGSGVTNMFDSFAGFKPSEACAWSGSVPSGRKFTAEVNTRVDGARDSVVVGKRREPNDVVKVWARADLDERISSTPCKRTFQETD